jgi:hypothetical protein
MLFLGPARIRGLDGILMTLSVPDKAEGSSKVEYDGPSAMRPFVVAIYLLLLGINVLSDDRLPISWMAKLFRYELPVVIDASHRNDVSVYPSREIVHLGSDNHLRLYPLTSCWAWSEDRDFWRFIYV